MKTKLLVIFCCILFFICIGCQGPAMRIKNISSFDFDSIEAAGSKWDDINKGNTSDYKSINEGPFDIYVTVQSTTVLVGKGTVTGKSILPIKWTLSIGDYTVDIKQD